MSGSGASRTVWRAACASFPRSTWVVPPGRVGSSAQCVTVSALVRPHGRRTIPSESTKQFWCSASSPLRCRVVKYIGRTSQNSSPTAVSESVTLSGGYRPVTAAATGVPLRGNLSRESTHVTAVFRFVISSLTQSLGRSSTVPVPTRWQGHCAELSTRKDRSVCTKVACDGASRAPRRPRPTPPRPSRSRRVTRADGTSAQGSPTGPATAAGGRIGRGSTRFSSARG